MLEKVNKEATNTASIETGMQVEASDADLGEEDVSKPKIVEILKDDQDNIEKIVVEKGVIFKKKLEIDVERIDSVEPDHTDNPSPGTVKIQMTEQETLDLRATGQEALPAYDENQAKPQEENDLLDKIEEKIPTDEGLRRKETANLERGARHEEAMPEEVPADQKRVHGGKFKEFTRNLGPGLLAGMAGNDSSAVASYSVDGATNGYGHLWLMLLSTPMYQAVEVACARVGRITQKGLAEVLREHYSRWICIVASLILIVANISLISADLSAIGSGFELITGIKWTWFVVPVALALWYVTVYRSYDQIKKVFMLMSLAFVTYLITAVSVKPDWGAVLHNTFIPQIDLSFGSISTAAALLGATISPYVMFWQVQGEKEEKRPGSTSQQLKSATWDIASGVLSGNLIAYAIIVCTSATLFINHQSINTAADAARGLEPLVGEYAKYLFALGLIGAGLIAIPVLLASTSYAVSGTFGLPSGLSKKPWQNEGFYLILTVALLVSLGISLSGIDAIKLMFWANILQAVLSPILLIFIILVGNNRKILGEHRFSIFLNIMLGLTVSVMLISTGFLFYGLLTGQSN